MPDVLIRNVPDADLDQIRAAAADEGSSLQRYLLETIAAHASHLRRQEALARIADRVESFSSVPEGERQAVLDAVAESHLTRDARLVGRVAQRG